MMNRIFIKKEAYNILHGTKIKSIMYRLFLLDIHDAQ